MTRETKIGLLMGLGFIVVFAVLLLQTGPKRQVGDDLEMLIAMQEKSPASLQQKLEANARLPEAVTPAQPHLQASPPPRDAVADAWTRAPEPWNSRLPKPRILDEKPEWGELGAGGSTMTELPELDRNQSEPAKIAPSGVPGPEVLPGQRPQAPEESPDLQSVPDPSISSSPSKSTGQDREPESGEQGTAREYTVQKGDNLGRIAQRFYSTKSQPVIDFLVRSNEDKIRNQHVVIEGQRLLIPVLPVHLSLNQADGFDASDAAADEGPVKLNVPPVITGLKPLEMERRAPEAMVKLDNDRDKPAKGSATSREASTKDKGQNSSDSRESTPRPGKSLPGTTDAKAGRESKRVAADDRVSRNESRDAAHRLYVIQPKDTLDSIARKELSGTQHWKDILRLNPDLNPSKLRTGDKIRLPKRKPSDRVASSARSSA